MIIHTGDILVVVMIVIEIILHMKNVQVLHHLIIIVKKDQPGESLVL